MLILVHDLKQMQNVKLGQTLCRAYENSFINIITARVLLFYSIDLNL